MKQYDVAAYIWPAYTGDEMRTRIFWPEGIGEWQTVKNMQPKEGGYVWDRKPVWGYVNEADPYVMEMQIEAAVSHGVNVFIYDWYWYDNRPFLENCLNDGFLKARNNDKMKFYLMWANHDALTIWDKRNAHVNNMVWSGKVNLEQFKIVGRRWIDQYFGHPSYYKIDGKPVISIYDIQNLVKGLGGVQQTKEAMEWLKEEVVQAGFPGVHLQMVKYGEEPTLNISGVDGNVDRNSQLGIFNELSMDSVTHYQFVHFTDMNRDYCEIADDAVKEWEKVNGQVECYFPHVSVGWDNNPRYIKYHDPVTKNNTPEEFEKLLKKAKDFVDAHDRVPLVTINSWNEWTETSYLEPDNLYGYGYLEAIKRVFKENE